MLKIYALSGMYEGLAKREKAVIIVKEDRTPLPLARWLARFCCRDTRECSLVDNKRRGSAHFLSISKLICIHHRLAKADPYLSKVYSTLNNIFATSKKKIRRVDKMPAAITPPAIPITKDLSVPKTSFLPTQNLDMANTKRKIICFSGTWC
jgi:hypothetical protein